MDAGSGGRQGMGRDEVPFVVGGGDGDEEDPLASAISSLEAEIFSGSGSGQLPSPRGRYWPGALDDGLRDQLSPPAGANATTSSGGGGGGGGSHKKMSHNAYERDRRKQLNELYSSLRSLLPDADHTKKLSIPITVTRVLKYIPELQKQVEGLEKKKDLLTRADAAAAAAASSSSTEIDGRAAPVVVSATCLDEKEIMLQVSLLGDATAAAAALPLSRCIKLLEEEGLHLVSSSTYSAIGGRTFYSLHLERAQGTMDKGCPAFCIDLEKIIRRNAGLHL